MDVCHDLKLSSRERGKDARNTPLDDAVVELWRPFSVTSSV
jgi:hypothetical protein